MKKKISVALATYNGELYIEEQLKSILNQTIIPDEIIISDNYSTDGTIKKCEQLLSKNSNISFKIIYEKKRSIIANFENALRSTTGDIIFLSDQDDIWYKDKIESFLKIFINNPQCCCVFSNSNLDIEKKEKMMSKLLKNENFFLKEGYVDKNQFFQMEIKKNIVTGMSLAITSKLKTVSLPLIECVYHDYWFAINAIFNGEVYYIDKTTAYYRQHKKNVVGANKKVNLKKLCKSVRNTRNQCINELNFLYIIKNKYPAATNCNLFNDKIDFLENRLAFICTPSVKSLLNIFKNNSYLLFYDNSLIKYKDLLYILFNTLFWRN